MDELALNEAMDRYACGDARAFPELHRALAARLLAYLARMCGSETLAGDLTQETFLRMHRARSSFARGGAVAPWAYAIARNVYLDHARAQKHRSTERLPSDPGAEPQDARGADAEAVAIASQTARVVELTLTRLPASQREAFILLRYEGLSVQDAAAILGTTASAVKLRAFRAYEALRAALDDFKQRPEAERGEDKRAERGSEKRVDSDEEQPAAATPERGGRRGKGQRSVRGGADGE
ncbi:RNA polymerase sigma factor [Sorangium sp. So ce1000]|uniref:RNA polymerase sigma factor n=1 Tax=Sorangium sp. So ce1000 TaxID=3133325 RepID=UPI003F62755B